MSQQSVIEELQHLGMSGYEAKAYVALVAAGTPLNGYEVAKHSGVPAQHRLRDPGQARRPRRGVRSAGGRGERRLHLAAAQRIARPDASRVRPLDRHAALCVARGRVPTAGPPGAQPLGPGIAAGQSRGRGRGGAQRPVPLRLAAGHRATQTAGAQGRRRGRRRLGRLLRRRPRPVGNTVAHQFSKPEVVLENLGCRLLVVSADREQAVIGGVVNGDAWGVYTDDPAVVLVAVEYVRHDIAMHLIAEKFDLEDFEQLLDVRPGSAQAARRPRGACGVAAPQRRQRADSSSPRRSRRRSST